MNEGNLKILRDESGNIVRIETEIRVALKKKERNWIAYSPDFNTLGYSTSSEDAAIEDFKQALDVFFTIHVQRNSLDVFLENHNWIRVDHSFRGAKRFNLPNVVAKQVTRTLEFA